DPRARAHRRPADARGGGQPLRQRPAPARGRPLSACAPGLPPAAELREENEEVRGGLRRERAAPGEVRRTTVQKGVEQDGAYRDSCSTLLLSKPCAVRRLARSPCPLRPGAQFSGVSGVMPP